MAVFKIGTTGGILL